MTSTGLRRRVLAILYNKKINEYGLLLIDMGKGLSLVCGCRSIATGMKSCNKINDLKSSVLPLITGNVTKNLFHGSD